MKQSVLPDTVHLNIRLLIALFQSESANTLTSPKSEGHACRCC